jgi:hypothetical protein
MTLSIAWVRKVGDTEELVFAADSRLSAGQDWDCCPKILTLPRSDCAICFAGDTDNAYPTMLQLKAAIDVFPKAFDRSLDIYELKGHALRIFNHMRNYISDLPVGQTEPSDPETLFIFGGYSWRKKRYAIWLLHYDESIKKFTFRPAGTWGGLGGMKKIALAGNYIEGAKEMLVRLLRERGKLESGNFDMEPFEVLRDIIRERRHDDIGGPLQMVKVYQHMNSGPFGVYWPNKEEGEITYLGRPLLDYEAPHAPIIDPYTLEIHRLYQKVANEPTSE